MNTRFMDKLNTARERKVLRGFPTSGAGVLVSSHASRIWLFPACVFPLSLSLVEHQISDRQHARCAVS